MRSLLLGSAAAMLLLGGPGMAEGQKEPDAKTIERGQKVYTDQKCSMCHSIDGKPHTRGPLDDVGARLSEEEIREWLINPRVMADKTKATRKPVMPEYKKLSKEDLNALVMYLKTLNKKK